MHRQGLRGGIGGVAERDTRPGTHVADRNPTSGPVRYFHHRGDQFGTLQALRASVKFNQGLFGGPA